MNFSRAVGFWVMGWILGRIPQWAPTWFMVPGADGGSTRALWLQVMSGLLVSLAAGYVLWRAWGLVAPWLRYRSPAELAVVRVAAAEERTRSWLSMRRERVGRERLRPHLARADRAAGTGG